LEGFHTASEVGDLDEGDEVGGASGDTADGFGDGDGFVFGGNNSGDACAFGSAEDGAKVVGVLDAVEDENEGVFPGLFDKLDEVAFVEAWGFGIFPRVRRFTVFAVAVFAGVHGRDCEE